MAPIKTKRRNDSNLIICGTPADKLPKPPDPSDNLLKPSLWKALEAVVAAGKRGLLGPAAAAPPVLNVGGSNGMFCQEAQNPIPLVTERRERKKPVIQKRSALVTVVRHVESKQSRANANMLRPQTQVNAPKQNPSLFPFFKPLHSSCMSAGKLSAGEWVWRSVHSTSSLDAVLTEYLSTTEDKWIILIDRKLKVAMHHIELEQKTC